MHVRLRTNCRHCMQLMLQVRRPFVNVNVHLVSLEIDANHATVETVHGRVGVDDWHVSCQHFAVVNLLSVRVSTMFSILIVGSRQWPIPRYDSCDVSASNDADNHIILWLCSFSKIDSGVIRSFINSNLCRFSQLLSGGVVYCFSWLLRFSCIYNSHGLCVCYWINEWMNKNIRHAVGLAYIHTCQPTSTCRAILRTAHV